ncbi:hypothetical protein [Aeromonas veronii]|uniref:Uncharacterized protein n=1 Tax=Aeromonas veronii TaxID=654 RepID=A0AAW5M3I7_AERVE|nr:hypothetical protein [Aeromonas veronii]ELV7508372.1 hypothetical protein [Aeromonas veronii]MCR4448153.1 hypothetical protein [Aeromonas veronii]
MLKKFSGNISQQFITSLDLGMRNLSHKNINISNAINLFNETSISLPKGLSSDTLSNILGSGVEFGVKTTTYKSLISLGIFNAGELEYIYQCIKDDAISPSIQYHLKNALREQLESDINYIIKNTHGFYECHNEVDLESFASSVIDNLSLDYELLISDDFDLINEHVSISELLDDINEYSSYEDEPDKIEQESPAKILSHIRTEQDEIDYMFRQLKS